MYASMGASYPDQISHVTAGRVLFFDPAVCPTFAQSYIPWVRSGACVRFPLLLPWSYDSPIYPPLSAGKLPFRAIMVVTCLVARAHVRYRNR